MTPEEFWSILHAAPPKAELIYRLYYDSATGKPLFYSMEDVPGTYIDIDQPTFAQNKSTVRVVDGKLIEYQWRTISKLIPTDDHGTPCHPWDVAIVVAENEQHQRWSKQTYEPN